ncbi:MAG: RagB/SusD family nutrient uptake outer membrane protein [Bacteroidales bacterium]|nr:RagB/SusD family nutrient uptake outer membrane protein [Bacteroidales bacterium]
MKNILKPLIILPFAILAMSCDKLLDAPTKSTMDESVIFSTPSFAKSAIAGVIHSMGETNSYRGRYYLYYGINTDVEVRELSGSTEGTDEHLTNYRTYPVNTAMNTVGTDGSPNNFYSMMYQGIERANIAIRGLRQYADLTNWEMRQILGEMLTLRAVLYVDLLKAFGNVPARFEPVSPETIYLPRASRDVVLKQLLIDLEDAADLVGWPNENTYTRLNTHINKAFVKGLRARVALMAGGYSMFVMESEMRKSTDPDLTTDKMMEIVKKECLDVINSGMARLQPPVGDYNSYEAWIRAVHAENNIAGNEVLWEIPFSIERGRVIHTWGIRYSGPQNRHTVLFNGSQIRPNPTLYYMFKKEDIRRDLTCIPYKWLTDAPGGPTAQPRQSLVDDRNQRSANLNNWSFGKHRYEWLSRRVTNINDDGLNFVFMRYSNILLMAAEAINYLDGPTAAEPYLRQIKERAYPDNPEIVASEMTIAMANSEAFFNAIVDERAKELAGEMYRKEDLIRWGIIDEKMAENRTNLTRLHNRGSGYANVNEYVYVKYAEDGYTLLFYGLEPGEMGVPDDVGSYTRFSWELSPASHDRPYWNRLFVRTPSLQPYWPIWDNVVSLSNGSLVNDPIFD